MYTCSLTELMELAYPETKSYFTVQGKIEFYQDLKDLAETLLTVEPNKARKKNGIDRYLLPFVTLHKITTSSELANLKESERYPNEISLSVLHNPLYEHEKTYNIGAPIKKRTLELRVEDVQLAEYLQIRKSQLMKEKYITFTDRAELMKLAKLDGTKHTGTANRALLQKLERLKEKNIIVNCPQQVNFPFHIKIRE
jgi:hypothetical protein